MSVRAITLVWDGSSHAGSELLMLLAIADFADDDGRAYPAVATLAAKCRTKPRYANVLLAGLKASGELHIGMNEGPKGTNLYRVVLEKLRARRDAPLHSSAPLHQSAPLHPDAGTPAPGCLKPLHPGADEPSLNRQEPKRARKRATSDGLTFSEWFPTAKGSEGKIFETNAELFAYQRKVGLPLEFIQLAWAVFKAKMLGSPKKRQLDWRQAFQNYVKGNWLKLWYADKAGQYSLSTVGIQAQREHA